MPDSRSAVVVAHAAHLLTVFGLVQRTRPDILIATHASRGAGRGQVDHVRAALAQVGHQGRVDCLPYDQADLYAALLAGESAPILRLADDIRAWLGEVQAEAVYGDAFEAYNVLHDLVRCCIDRAGHELGFANFEFPLSSQQPGAPLRYGTFQSGPEPLRERLSESHLTVKRQLVEYVAQMDPFVEQASTEFYAIEVEQYRAVPASRSYQQPPPGLALHYDELGRRAVASGNYAQAITFHAHFVPAVQALGMG